MRVFARLLGHVIRVCENVTPVNNTQYTVCIYADQFITSIYLGYGQKSKEMVVIFRSEEAKSYSCDVLICLTQLENRQLLSMMLASVMHAAIPVH